MDIEKKFTIRNKIEVNASFTIRFIRKSFIKVSFDNLIVKYLVYYDWLDGAMDWDCLDIEDIILVEKSTSLIRDHKGCRYLSICVN